MKSIYKYPIDINDDVILLMPEGARILSVDTQTIPGESVGIGMRTHDGEQLCLWALVDPDAIEKAYHLRIYGTGHPVEEADLAHLNFIGTVSMSGGALIWHIFENTFPMDTFPSTTRHLN